jgi:hypothetical protein
VEVVVRELLGRVTIGGVVHARYRTALRTPCGIDSAEPVAPFGVLTCPCCAEVAPLWDEIDRKPPGEPRPEGCEGTRSSYWRGCRCDECKLAHSTYQRRYRSGERKERVAAVCGTSNGYSRGCRCDLCRQARRRYDQARYQARKHAEIGVAA